MICKKCGNELLDDSVFCNKCGSKMAMNSGVDILAIFKGFKMKFNKKIIIIGSIGVILIGAIITMVIILNNPIGKLKGLINNSKSVEASAIYNEKIKGNLSKETEVGNFLKSDIEMIKKDFNENKLQYNPAISQLNTIDNMGLVSTEVVTARSEINKLNDSRTSFKKGNDLLNNKNYKEALSEFNKVIKDDESYSKAQELINGSINEYRTAMLSEVETAVKSSDYDKAISLLNEALAVMPNDSDITAKKYSYDKINVENKAVENKKKMDDLKNNQEISVEKAGIIILDDRYKALYPDMIRVISRNNTNKTVKNMKVSCLGYDLNGFPIKIKIQFNYFSSSYEFIGSADNVNIVPKATYGNDVGWSLDDPHGIKTVLACVKEVEYYDGSTWTNPYYDIWINEYKEKQLH